jgi:hypothetical protein
MAFLAGLLVLGHCGLYQSLAGDTYGLACAAGLNLVLIAWLCGTGAFHVVPVAVELTVLITVTFLARLLLAVLGYCGLYQILIGHI